MAGAQRPTTFGHFSVHCGKERSCLCLCLSVPFPTRPLGNGRGTSTSVLPSCRLASLTCLPSLNPAWLLLDSGFYRPDYSHVSLPVLTSKLRPHTGRILVWLSSRHDTPMMMVVMLMMMALLALLASRISHLATLLWATLGPGLNSSTSTHLRSSHSVWVADEATTDAIGHDALPSSAAAKGLVVKPCRWQTLTAFASSTE